MKRQRKQEEIDNVDLGVLGKFTAEVIYYMEGEKMVLTHFLIYLDEKERNLVYELDDDGMDTVKDMVKARIDEQFTEIRCVSGDRDWS